MDDSDLRGSRGPLSPPPSAESSLFLLVLTVLIPSNIGRLIATAGWAGTWERMAAHATAHATGLTRPRGGSCSARFVSSAQPQVSRGHTNAAIDPHICTCSLSSHTLLPGLLLGGGGACHKPGRALLVSRARAAPRGYGAWKTTKPTTRPLQPAPRRGQHRARAGRAAKSPQRCHDLLMMS